MRLFYTKPFKWLRASRWPVLFAGRPGPGFDSTRVWLRLMAVSEIEQLLARKQVETAIECPLCGAQRMLLAPCLWMFKWRVNAICGCREELRAKKLDEWRRKEGLKPENIAREIERLRQEVSALKSGKDQQP
jgi:hypothetical protein